MWHRGPDRIGITGSVPRGFEPVSVEHYEQSAKLIILRDPSSGITEKGVVDAWSQELRGEK